VREPNASTLDSAYVISALEPGVDMDTGMNHAIELLEARQFLAGTSNPSSLVAAVEGTELIAIGQNMFFAGKSANAGTELWKSDGTTAGTTVLVDIVPGTGSSSPRQLRSVGDLLYFSANDGNGHDPWRTDGTSAGTLKLTDVNGTSNNALPVEFTAFNGTVYFASNAQLWETDGTASGTRIIVDLTAQFVLRIRDLFVFDNRLLFVSSSGSEASLWSSDGTAAGTQLLATFVDRYGHHDFATREFVRVGDLVFFHNFDLGNTRLFVTDACYR
jgi:ELWxxDGT repeat protein